MELSEADKTLNPGVLTVLLKNPVLGSYLFCDLFIWFTFLIVTNDSFLQRTWTKLLKRQLKGCHQKEILIQNHVNRRYRDLFSCVDIWISSWRITCIAVWLSNIKSLLFRVIRIELHCLTTVRALALSQIWVTKAACPLTIIAAIWCWVSAQLLQPLLMRPSALTHRSWQPWSWSCPRGVGQGIDLTLQDL